MNEARLSLLTSQVGRSQDVNSQETKVFTYPQPSWE